jgi:hypothetical protein
LPYLAIIVVFEYGSTLGWFAINHHNLWSVNFEITFEFLFYSWFILSDFKNKKLKRRLAGLVAGIVVFTAFDIAFIQGFHKLCTIAILVQYTLLIALACLFFYRQLHTFDVSTSLLGQPDFWVHTGLLFFFLTEFLFFASFTTMAYKKIPNFALLHNVISTVSIFILYSCLSVSFLCFRRMTKSSL